MHLFYVVLTFVGTGGPNNVARIMKQFRLNKKKNDF